MGKATCEVSGKDYLRYWGGEGASPVPPANLWTGEERRRGAQRRNGHDRRWQTVLGRRFIAPGGRRESDR